MRVMIIKICGMQVYLDEPEKMFVIYFLQLPEIWRLSKYMLQSTNVILFTKKKITNVIFSDKKRMTNKEHWDK